MAQYKLGKAKSPAEKATIIAEYRAAEKKRNIQRKKSLDTGVKAAKKKRDEMVKKLAKRRREKETAMRKQERELKKIEKEEKQLEKEAKKVEKEEKAAAKKVKSVEVTYGNQLLQKTRKLS